MPQNKPAVEELENTIARLTSQLNQRAQEVAVINAVQEGLAKEMDMQGIYDLVGEKIAAVFGAQAQALIIATFNLDTESEYFQYCIEKGERAYPGGRLFDNLRQTLAEKKEKIIINSSDESYTWFRDKVIAGKPMSSGVFIPLLIGDRITGYVSLQNVDKENAFSESDISLIETLANSMSVALENARLFNETNRLLKETEQGKAELAVINSVQEGLVREMNIQGIYNLVGNRIRELFNAQCVIIATFDYERGTENFNYHIEKGEISYPKPRPYDKVRQHLITTGQNILINENFKKAADEFGMKIVPGTEAPKSLLFMPMKVSDKVTGYVSLQNLDEEHAFSFSDVRLLSTLANSMSVALENARLFDETSRLLKETEQQKAELAVINSVQEGLARELDISAIYELVGDRLCRLFPDTQTLVIRTFDHENDLEHFQYVIEKGKRFFSDPRPIIWANRLLFSDKKTLYINHNYEETARKYSSRAVTAGEVPKSAVFVPMIVGDSVKGSISLQNMDKENAFSESDIRLITTLTNSMSVALENARLFDETNRLLKETEQRTAELAVINSVQEGLVREMDMKGIYNLVGDRVQQLFNAQVVIIATFDQPNNLEYFNYVFENNEKVDAQPRPINNLRQDIIDQRHTIYIRSKAQAKHEYGLTSAVGDTTMPKSSLFVPLVTGTEIKGYVSLQNLETEAAFSDPDVRLLETLANSMSVALENARLFDETNRLLKETEQRTAELAVINSVQEGLVREMDMQGIYDLVGDRVQQLFNAQGVIIATFDQANGLEYFNYLFENNERVTAPPRLINDLRQKIIDQRRTIHIKSRAQAKEEYGINSAIADTKMSKSLLFVPLVAGNDIKGYVSLQNLDIEDAFSDPDVRLLETLANSMSVALENARLFDETNRLLKETEQRTAELAVINSVQEGLVREMDMQGIYDLVGDRVQQLFNAQGVIIATFDQASGLEYFNYLFENNQRVTAPPRHISALRQKIIDQRRTIYIKSKAALREEFGITSAIVGTLLPKSSLFVPLVTGNEIKGYVSLQNLETEAAFSDPDVRLLETLANSMSVALENARLFDETNRLLKETEQRTAELAVINSVQEGLVREMDMQGIYNLVGDRVQQLFNAQAVIIATFDQPNNLEYFNYVFENNAKVKLPPRQINSLRQKIIDQRHTIYVKTEAQAKEEFGITSAIADTKMPKSFLFVPLVAGNDIKGYVSLQNLEIEAAFSDPDVRLLETLANSMSVALENARLFDETNRLLKETEQRTAELAVINSVQEGLVREMNIQAIYDLVGDRLCKLFPETQTLVIRTFDHENGQELWQYAIEKGQRLTSEPRPFNWANKQLLLTRQPLHITDNYLETAKKFGGSGVTHGKPPKSAVFVPMIVGDVVKGSVSLQNVDLENAFSDSDVRLLTTLTNSMSVALENARLFDETNRLLKETEQRTAELAVINSVQDGLVREMDIQAIYEIVGARLCNLFNIQTVVIRTFELESGTEFWRYAIEKGERLYSDPRPLNWANNQLLKTKRSLIINSGYLETAKKYGGTGVSHGKPPKSAVFVPMIVGDVVKGSVSLQNVDIEHAFSESDIRLLTTLINSMSVALENARLFDETAHLLAEAKQRAAELGTVNNISKALASQLDTDELIQFVGDEMKELFNANIVYLALLNQKTKMISFPYQYGDDMALMKLGEGFTSQIILSGEPMLINKDLQELRERLGVNMVGKAAASYLGVPIPVGDEIIGVLSIQSTEQENRFDEDDQRLLSTIAASVGVAMKNATLFEEVKLAKMEAEAAGNAAEKANEAKSAFLSTVSHELRTPLTSVLGFTKIIRKRLDEKIFPLVDRSDAKTEKAISQVSENLQVVISEGERLTHLINDVLDLAKIEAGKMEWNFEEVSMSEVAERAISATSSLFDQKSVTLEKHIEKNLPIIMGDKDKLIQVIINLISNAVKFTEDGSVSCKVYRRKNEIIVGITDTGIGIAPEFHDAVFEQFKQVGGDTLTDKPKGTGLGLPICRQIVEHHSGRIWLESEAGKGSTFSFALKLKPADAVVKPVGLNDLVLQLKEQIALSPFQGLGKNATILIVDDDNSIRTLLHQELSEAGYLIEEAVNGKEALEKVRKNKPDLIILDVMMPEMNGFDVAAILKNDPQTMAIPIIILSITQDKVRGFKIGVDRYLNKPIDTAELFSEVEALLEQGKSKKKVMVVDEDTTALRTLTDVLETKGYHVVESDGIGLLEKAVLNQPDIIILNSLHGDNQEMIQSLRFEKGLENVLFLLYQ